MTQAATASQALYLPKTARVPRTTDFARIDYQNRIWRRAQTLFLPQNGPDTGYTAAGIEPSVYALRKPASETVYRVDMNQHTCDCPEFAKGAFCKHYAAVCHHLATYGSLPGQ